MCSRCMQDVVNAALDWIERLYAFESYCRRTSKLRVASVCLALSLLAFLISISLELIPLQDQKEGWRANHGCWIRLFCIAFIVTIGATMQINGLVPKLKLTAIQFLGCAFATRPVSMSLSTLASPQAGSFRCPLQS